MVKKNIRYLALIVLVLLGTANFADAQLVRGFVSGTVTDSMNAVIPGAQITIRNKATNISRDTVTNGVGFYRLAAVEPGEYSVEFKMPGFERKKIESVTVSTAQEVLLNQTLSPGNITAEVSVTDSPGVELAKTTATIERTFSASVVMELPLQAGTIRDITQLALLSPTVSRAPGSSGFSANGQRARNNNFTIDGVDNNDISITVNSALLSPESLQEVQVQTTAYSAESGHSSGAQFSAITKSGSNLVHGETYDYYAGNWLEPLALQNKRAGLTGTPRYSQNQFGGHIGGPILKDRTFIFGLLEFNRFRGAPDARNGASTPANVPTAAGYAALANVPLGPGETDPARQAALSALGFLPGVYSQHSNFTNVTTVPVNGVPIEVGTLVFPLANPFNFAYNVVRADHRISDRDNISYRYHLDKRNQPDVVSNLQFGTMWSAAQMIFKQNHAISETHIFNAHSLNEFRAAYTRSNLAFPENDPVSSTVGITGFFTIGGLSNFPQGRLDQTFQYQDVVSYTAGRHALKFGADLQRNNAFNRTGNDSKGTWAYSGLASFLNSTPTSLTQSVNDASFTAKQWSSAFFFQDDFKARRDLTLNLGLRYAYSTVPLGLLGATDPVVQAAGVPGPAQPDKNNWAPRIGFAYSPNAPQGMLAPLLGNGKTSIRGGFGMAYDVVFNNIIILEANNYPRVVNSLITSPNANNLFPTLAPKVPTVPVFNPLAQFVNVPSDIQNPTTNFWSLSVQREIGTGYSVEVGYSGNRSYHQFRQNQANPPILTAAQAATVIAAGTPNPPGFPSLQQRRLNPAWGSRVLLEAAAKASYNAGYVRFDKKMAKGLFIGANYTFSTNLSDNDEALAVAGLTDSSAQTPEDFSNYRKEWSRSAFDRPHRLSVNYAYQIPWFSKTSASLRQLFGGWQLSGFSEYQSGQPFTIRTGVDTAGIGTATPARPDYNPNGLITKDPGTGDFRTFVTPINGTGIVTVPLSPTGVILANSMPGGGNLGKNTFRGPSFQQWNFSLQKNISISERWKMQIRSDFVNLWNHNNFANPVNTMISSAFGQNIANLISDGRQVSLSGRIKF